jgi:hypothetical protein
MDSEARAAAWSFVLVLTGFKIGIALLIFSLQPSAAAAIFLLGIQWYWVVPLAVLLAPLVMFRVRLHRARARRSRLIEAEWRVDPPAEWKAGRARGRM